MAQKQYNVATRSYEALPRSKRLRARGRSSESNHRNAGGSVVVMGGGDGHTHANKSVLDSQSMDVEGYLYLKRKPADEADSTTEKVKAGWADKSGHAEKADDSTQWNGNQFTDYLNQPLRKEDSVNFLKVIAQMFSTPDYKKGDMNGGAGAAVYKEGDSTVMEIDKLIVRKEASFSEVVINQTTFQLGETVFSRGGCSLIHVETFDDYYRCYYDNKAGKRYSGFAEGDLARCQRFDESYGGIIKYYWRKVVALDNEAGYVDLSRVSGEYDGMGEPAAGDDIVHFGNVEEPSRQSALVISPLNGGSLTVLSAINSFSLTDTDYVGMGVRYDDTYKAYRAYIYGYGDVYFGDRAKSQFIEYVNGVMNINANINIGADSKYGDTTLGQAFQAVDTKAETAKTSAEAAAKAASASATITSQLNNDSFLTPVEKRSLRQMMAALSDSEGVAEPYWATISHETMVGSPWYRVQLGDKSNDKLQDNWVGWWSSNSVDKHNTASLQAVALNSNSDNRGISISYNSDAEGSYDYLTIESNGSEIGTTKGKQNTIQELSVLLTKGYTYYEFIYHKDRSDNVGTDAGYYKIEGTDSEYWNGTTQYLCYKGSYPTLYAALYNAGKVDEANELKTRFTAIIDCLQLADVYGDSSGENTSLEEVYAEFRTDLQKALNDYFNYVEICNLNDVDYLKKVFPNATLDANGATLSLLLGVKDGTADDANIVAGLYGGGSNELNANGFCDYDETGKKRHGILMFFAGAEGLDDVTSAATRVYEDGTVIAAKGKVVFNPDGSGHLASGRLSWDRNGKISSYYPIEPKWADLSKNDDGEISFSSSAFINIPMDDGEALIPSPSNAVGRFELRVPPITRSGNEYTFRSEVPITYFGHGGEQHIGTHLRFPISTTPNIKYVFEANTTMDGWILETTGIVSDNAAELILADLIIT